MGNGSMKSKRYKHTDGHGCGFKHPSVDSLRARVDELEREGKRREEELCGKEQQIKGLQEQLANQTQALAELSEELQNKCIQLNKLQDVMKNQSGAAALVSRPPSVKTCGKNSPNLSVRIKETLNRRKGAKAGVSAEPTSRTYDSSSLPKFSFEKARIPKDASVKKLLADALNKNQYLRRLELQQVKDMVECMYERTYQQGEYVIQQGEPGNHLFVLADGKLDVFQHNKLLTSITVWTTFGELAILYNCTRTASVRAVNKVRTWALDREVFQNIMRRTAETRHEQYRNFLRSVSLLANLPEDKLSKIVDCLEVVSYSVSPSRFDFSLLLPPPPPDVADSCCQNIITIWAVYHYCTSALSAPPPTPHSARTHKLRALMNRVDIIPAAETGSRWREMINHFMDRQKNNGNRERGKTLNKTGQMEVEWLKSILKLCFSFCRLYRTFKDNKYVYMLLEACLGGEVWSLLRDRGSFDEQTAKFCVGCVTEAFDYLHRKGVLYRDLKPENLMLDTEGYIKLVDFGFAKKIRCGQKTWTFCGTPEYVAPEIILNKGHNFSVDFWSLGILVFELLTGSPPFSGSDQMMTYTFILKGIEKMDFPKKVTKRPEDLIRKLCRRNPAERLGNLKNGITDIKKHRWFNGFNWEGLKVRTLLSPLKRELSGPTDHSYFDSYPPDEDSPPDELSGWDMDF
ncbi:cGMP-dependent protein kinase 2 [Labrus bergylta]|uniref:cGMP-dependent protein kinase 2 n=1 Tax=Labrus bergylta TaxID=56723 RepID=UPI003313B02E